MPGFAQQGCWLTCHDGQRDMPKQFTKEEVAANALLTALKKGDVRKYLPATRTDPSGWPTTVTSSNSANMGFDPNAGWKDGMWTVVMIRPLGLANDDDITTRGHHVSFVRTLGFGANASIQAVKLP